MLLAPGRLVTLTGTGGCGKTQLALLVAASLTDTADGVWLVDLAPVQAPHLVPYAVAAVLGRRERPGEALLDTLVAYLTARDLLLVLDNCEHLIDACAPDVDRGRLIEHVLDQFACKPHPPTACPTWLGDPPAHAAYSPRLHHAPWPPERPPSAQDHGSGWPASY